MSEPRKFKDGQIVKHKNGNIYRIIGMGTYEPLMSQCYVYVGIDDEDRWIRPQGVMEDGRFTLLNPSDN